MKAEVRPKPTMVLRANTLNTCSQPTDWTNCLAIRVLAMEARAKPEYRKA